MAAASRELATGSSPLCSSDPGSNHGRSRTCKAVVTMKFEHDSYHIINNSNIPMTCDDVVAEGKSLMFVRFEVTSSSKFSLLRFGVHRVHPSQELFSETDIDKQGAKLMKTLGIAVGSLDKMDKLVPVLQNLGKRHVSYGVTAVMYPSVGQALLLTFDKCLGEECTPETKEAWAWVFGVISGVCIQAAKEVDPSY